MEENSFSKWVKENYYPTGIVFSTQRAKKIISKNNLTPSEFLRPFGIIKEIYFSPNEKFRKIIKNFRLDFYDSYAYKKADQNILQKLTDNLLLNANIIPNWSLNEILADKSLVSLHTQLKDYSYPWFNEYQNLLFEFLKFNEYEIYQQPFVYIYVCSIEDPFDIIIPKGNKDKIPTLIQEKIYYDKMPVLVLILQDMSDKKNILSQEKKNYFILGFKKKFNDFYLLYWEINSNDPISSPIKDDIWKKYIHKIDYYSQRDKTDVIRGGYISKQERIKFHESFVDFMKKYVIQILNEIVRNIDEELQNTKRGLKNSFLSILRRSDKIEYSKLFKIYSLTSLEKKEYLNAIIQFYFQNYESAYESLKFFMSDIKSKSPQHYNAAYELSTICYYVIHPSEREIDPEDVYQKYIKYSQFNQALRALILMMKIYEQKGQFQRLPRSVIFAVRELPHSQTKNEKEQFLPHNRVLSRISPLLFEKMSTYYLLHPLNQFRKYIFYIILSGTYYKNESPEYQKYCLHSYSTIFKFIDNKTHSFIRIKEEINRQMGIICQDIKYCQGGLRFFKNCVELEKYSKKKIINQAHYDKMLLCLNQVLNAQKIGSILESININDLSIPEVDNTSLLIIEEQDYQIAEEKKSKGNWLLFKEFSRVPLKKIYLSLTPDDIISLRNLDNILQKKQNFSNFFSKRNFKGNVNNKMYVRFTIKNPLNYNLNVSNMKLICDFTSKNDSSKNINDSDNNIEYQSVKLVLQSKTSREIELYCKPKTEGHCVIRGVEIVLDNIGIVKHYFNTENQNQLYKYRITRRKSSQNEKKNNAFNKESTSSKNKKKLNLKSDITFDIIDNNSDLLIEFPMGKEIDVYKNQLLLMPIKITNNSPAKIKRFCLFFLEKDNDDIANQSLLCKYIYKEVDLFIEEKKGEKEVIVYVPIIPKREGEIYIKILVKYEEEIKFKNNECKRFLIKLNVKSSVEFEISEEILSFDHENIDDNLFKITNFGLDIMPYIKNKKSLTSLKVENYILMGNNFIREDSEDFTWEKLGKDAEHQKLYHRFRFKKKTKYIKNSLSSFLGTLSMHNTNKKRIIEANELQKKLKFDFLPDYIKNDPLQSHVQNKFAHSILDNKLLFIWSCKDNINNNINGMYFYKTSLKKPKTGVKFIKQLMKNISNINIAQIAIDNHHTLIQIIFELDNKSLLEINKILYYEVYVNENEDSSGVFQWMGLKKYKINNKKTRDMNKLKLSFSCICSKKGKVDINKIAMKIFLKDVIESPILLTNIPHPVLINVS